MFKRFIYWLLGVDFWKTASRGRKTFTITVLAAHLAWIAWSLFVGYRIDKEIDKELRAEQESEPDIFEM